LRLCLTAGLELSLACDAATLERWNVLNRVLPDGELAEKSMAFARRLADGPTLAWPLTDGPGELRRPLS
jgi:hypothetical protein